MRRSMAGFGPKDIFQNPESMFRQFESTDGDSPFDLRLSLSGDDFAVMGMHLGWGLDTNLREPVRLVDLRPILSCWSPGRSRPSRSWRMSQPWHHWRSCEA